MRIIDRYLVRQFVQVFIICFVSLTGLYIVFDAFTNLDAFMEAAKHQGGLMAVMGRFYLFRALSFFNLASGVLALIAAMFTITLFQRHNEMTALMAAGVSRARVSLPVILAAVTVSLGAAAARELVLPQFIKELSQDPKDLMGEAAKPFSPRYDNETGILLRGKSTLAKESQITLPNFLLPDDLARYGVNLEAENATYKPAKGDRPGGYLLSGIHRPVELPQKPSLRGGESSDKIILTPVDTDWLKPHQVFVVSNVSFEQLTGGDGWMQYSRVTSLMDAMRNKSLDFGADVKVAVHARLIRPLLDINLLFLGIPLILARDNRNIFLAVGLCLLVVSGFLICVYGMHFLGSSLYVSPHLAAWSPLLIFVPLAAAMADPFRT
jgi:lipopolysaccharide export system permease protein